MCDTERRCDRPSCPCNEPDTELKDALARMQERFPEPWKCSVGISASGNGWLALAEFGRADVQAACYGRTPHAAVEAAIKAHDDMVKADALFKALKAECEAWRVWHAKYHRALSGEQVDCLDEWFGLDAARAATDRAGALR